MKFRNLLGYVVGSAIFLVLFPYLIRIISQKFAFLPIVFGAPFFMLGSYLYRSFKHPNETHRQRESRRWL